MKGLQREEGYFFSRFLLAVTKNMIIFARYLLTNLTFQNNAKNENKCRCKEAFFFHRHR